MNIAYSKLTTNDQIPLRDLQVEDTHWRDLQVGDIHVNGETAPPYLTGEDYDECAQVHQYIGNPVTINTVAPAPETLLAARIDAASSGKTGLLPLPITTCLEKRVNLPFRHKTVGDCFKSIFILIVYPAVGFAALAWVYFLGYLFLRFVFSL